MNPSSWMAELDRRSAVFGKGRPRWLRLGVPAAISVGAAAGLLAVAIGEGVGAAAPYVVATIAGAIAMLYGEEQRARRARDRR